MQFIISEIKNEPGHYFENVSQVDRLDSSFGNELRRFLNERADPQTQVFSHSTFEFIYCTLKMSIIWKCTIRNRIASNGIDRSLMMLPAGILHHCGIMRIQENMLPNNEVMSRYKIIVQT